MARSSVQKFDNDRKIAVSTISERDLHVTNLSEMDNFVRVCNEKMIDNRYSENSARNIHSD